MNPLKCIFEIKVKNIRFIKFSFRKNEEKTKEKIPKSAFLINKIQYYGDVGLTENTHFMDGAPILVQSTIGKQYNNCCVCIKPDIYRISK